MVGAAETLTKEEARDAFTQAGVAVSNDQLERWRGLGLLPPARQRGLGKGRGSTVDFDVHEVAQAIDIARLFQERRKIAWVGWRLWLRGHEVHDRYWRDAIQQARGALAAAQNATASIERLSDAGMADLIRALPTLLAGTPFAAPLGRMDAGIAETMVSFFQEIVAGRFDGLSHDDDGQEQKALVAIAGSVRADQDHVQGQKLNLNAQLEGALRDVSVGIAVLENAAGQNAPSADLRLEFVTVIAIARDATSLLSRNRSMSAFGLSTLHRILRDSNIVTEATMLLFWERVREVSLSLLSPVEVIELGKVITAVANANK